MILNHTIDVNYMKIRNKELCFEYYEVIISGGA